MHTAIDHLPKVELHLHLDCSLSYEVASILQPGLTQKEFQDRFTIAHKCNGLSDFLERTVPAIQLMQSAENLELVTRDIYRQLAADQVIYAEIRFSPLLHLQQGLNAEQVCEAVIRGVQAGKTRYGIDGGLIICTLRHYDEGQSLHCAELAYQYQCEHVLGFDIASDEAGFPIDAHIAAFRYAHEHGLPCTAHGGEGRGADSIWEILENFHPRRLGHGVRCIEDARLMQFLADNNIHLELCPSSNIKLDLFETLADHPANKFYEADLSISINTDGRTIFDVTLADEYSNLASTFDWDSRHFLYCNLEAVRHAFCTEEVKRRVTEKLIAAYRVDKSD